jgi:hypothetical protein
LQVIRGQVLLIDVRLVRCEDSRHSNAETCDEIGATLDSIADGLAGIIDELREAN